MLIFGWTFLLMNHSLSVIWRASRLLNVLEVCVLVCVCVCPSWVTYLATAANIRRQQGVWLRQCQRLSHLAYNKPPKKSEREKGNEREERQTEAQVQGLARLQGEGCGKTFGRRLLFAFPGSGNREASKFCQVSKQQLTILHFKSQSPRRAEYTQNPS